MAHSDKAHGRGERVSGAHANARDLTASYRAERHAPAPEGAWEALGTHMATRPVLRPGKTARDRAAA